MGQDSLAFASARLPDLVGDVFALEMALAEDFARMEEALTAVIAIVRDDRVQKRLRPAGSVGPFALRLPGADAWLMVGGKNHGLVVRVAPVNVAIAALGQDLEQDADASAELRKAVQRSGAAQAAQTIVRNYCQPSAIPDRSAAANMFRWSAAVDTLAYAAAGRATALLEAMRPSLIARGLVDDEESRIARRKYWMITTLLARCVALSATPEAHGWLSTMAGSLPADGWTPSRWLVRERSGWFTAIGAKSAASFGSSVHDRYLKRLHESRHPVDILDALVGLTAIGLALPADATALANEISLYRHSPAVGSVMMPDYADAALGQASAMLQNPHAALAEGQRYFEPRKDGRSPFGIPDLLRLDPTDADPSKQILGLQLVPLTVASPINAFFPQKKPRAGTSAGLIDGEISAMFNRTWTGAVAGETLQ